MTRKKEVQTILNKIKDYVIKDNVTLECHKVEKAKAVIKMNNICAETVTEEKCQEILRNILMEEIPGIVDVSVYKENR